MLTIDKLEVEGFRGFPKKSGEIIFSSPAVLFFGDNHQGKSTAINAIEWCIFGDQCIGSKSGIRERVGGWEIVNRKSSSASVKLEMCLDGNKYVIERKTPKKGKKGKTLTLCLPDNSELKDIEAEQELRKIIKLSYKDFSTTVYQHQETIRDIVIQKPKDRNDGIDRLLGLSD